MVNGDDPAITAATQTTLVSNETKFDQILSV